MGNTMHQRHIEKQERVSDEDFTTLFAQLDRKDAVAPIEHGLSHMMVSIEALRRKSVRRRT